MAKILNSYTRYFNLTHKRKGPLWTGRFKNVAILRDEQLLHLTRYLHLNPVSANLVKRPDKWHFSSFIEYTGQEKDGMCQFQDLIQISSKTYRKFVFNRASYQKELSKIKRVLIEDYTG